MDKRKFEVLTLLERSFRAQNFTSLLFYLKHDAFKIADPGSMQDACYINFVIDLTHRRVSLAQL